MVAVCADSIRVIVACCIGLFVSLSVIVPFSPAGPADDMRLVTLSKMYLSACVGSEMNRRCPSVQMEMISSCSSLLAFIFASVCSFAVCSACRNWLYFCSNSCLILAILMGNVSGMFLLLLCRSTMLLAVLRNVSAVCRSVLVLGKSDLACS